MGRAQSAAPAPQRVPPVQSASEDKTPADVAEAEAAMAKRDWKAAGTKLDAYLATHPADARALFDAGYVADAENRSEDAAAFYGRSVAADPRLFEARLSLGLLLARQGKAEEAREQLEVATQLDPGDAAAALKARAWRALAEIDSTRDAAQASAELLEALKLTPETAEDTLMAARLAEAAGQPEAAEAAYRRLLKSDPKSATAVAGLAHLLMRQKKYAEAEALLRPAVAAAPNDPVLTAQLAGVLAAEDNPDALPLLEKLHAAHPADTSITRMLADVRAQAGDAAGSEKLYAALLAASPDDPELLVAHAENLTRQLKYAEAFVVFEKAAQLDPDSGDAWSGLAFAASKTGQPAIALHALTMRSKFLPEVPSTYFLWATSYDTMHDKDRAIAYYHHFLDSAGGRFPNQEWQARQRLLILEKKK